MTNPNSIIELSLHVGALPHRGLDALLPRCFLLHMRVLTRFVRTHSLLTFRTC